jgi:predicted GH43/DUF377 family glycosyl hydrolase
MNLTRRSIVAGCAAAGLVGRSRGEAADAFAPFRTPYKFNKLILEASGVDGSFDKLAVDDPFVFRAEGRFYMLHVGFDGIGYQSGLAVSDDLLHWKRTGLIFPRDPSSKVFRYNAALSCILHDAELGSACELQKVDGRYVGVWQAYPSPGYEEGAALMGLAWSDDFRHWERGDVILEPDPGAEWEAGGLYKPYLIKVGDTFFLYYNAKDKGARWHEQSGVATSKDLKTWTRCRGNPILRNGPADSRDARFASNPWVVRAGSQWAMYYFGLPNAGHACDLLALGSDPFHFEKVPEVIVEVGPPGSVDETHAHKPALMTWQGDLYHFYCAVSGKWPNERRGITVARSRPWS